jgi:hypothetical protein
MPFTWQCYYDRSATFHEAFSAFAKSIPTINKEWACYLGLPPYVGRCLQNPGNDEKLKAWGRDLCVRLEIWYSVRLLSNIIASLPRTDEVLTFDD